MSTKIFNNEGQVKRRCATPQLLRDYARANAVARVEIVAHGTGAHTVVVNYTNGSTGTAQQLTAHEAKDYCVGRDGFPHAIIRAEITT